MAAEPPATPGVVGLSRGAVLGGVLCIVLWAAVAVAGPSAAAPALGPGLLPFDLRLSPSSALVTSLQAASVLAGGSALVCGLLASARGWTARGLLVVAFVGALLAVLLPPVGSADHLSYAAYGRITALGGDAYAQAPDDFAGGQDPVVSGVRDPWRWTTSVYGPVATLLQGLVSILGGDSVRATVWGWQLLLGLVWAASAVVAHRTLTGPARVRVLVLWSANPLLLTTGLGGAHADVLAGSAAFLTVLLAWRHPWTAGLALGVAAGVKLPYGAAGAGLLVAWWLSRRGTSPDRRSVGWLLSGALGALLVLVPAHVWAGMDAYEQTRRASRYVSLVSVWRRFSDDGMDRELLLPGMLVLMLVVAAVWWRRLVPTAPTLPTLPAGAEEAFRWRAAGVTAVLALGYLLAAPYVLPWYDTLLWGPLALVLRLPWLQALLVARSTLLALAYVPGLVDGMSPAVEDLTLGYRRQVGPWVSWVALLGALALGVLGPRARPGPATVPVRDRGDTDG